MKIQENKAILRRMIEEVNKGNSNQIWNLLTPDCEIIDNTGKRYNVRDYKQFMDEFLSAHPDYNLFIKDLIAEGNKVVAHYNESGTMKGSFMGMKPTGKKFMIPAIEIYQFANGKITNVWMARDTLAISMQVGAIPELV